jgi:hypothetical protein
MPLGSTGHQARAAKEEGGGRGLVLMLGWRECHVEGFTIMGAEPTEGLEGSDGSQDKLGLALPQ